MSVSAHLERPIRRPTLTLRQASGWNAFGPRRMAAAEVARGPTGQARLAVKLIGALICPSCE